MLDLIANDSSVTADGEADIVCAKRGRHLVNEPIGISSKKDVHAPDATRQHAVENRAMPAEFAKSYCLVIVVLGKEVSSDGPQPVEIMDITIQERQQSKAVLASDLP